MIIDTIENIDLYNEIPQHAIEFIKKLHCDIETGRYELSDSDFANIEVYSTKSVNEAKFEAHNDYIDIQILLEGKENIYYTQKKYLKVLTPYNSEKDIEFYEDAVIDYNYLTLDGTNFAIIYPHEGHAPQVEYDNLKSEVKKVVLKLKKV